MLARATPERPDLGCFLVMMLITPPDPSALYCAGGLFSTSMRSMSLAGSCSRLRPCAAPESPAEGLPSMRMVTFASPLRLTTPSGSTLTDGSSFMTSAAEPVVAWMSPVTV